MPADHRTVEDPCAHADQRFVLDRAAVEDGLMADRDSRAERQWRSRIAMADRSVLEVGLIAKNDRRVVGPDNRAEPDAAAVS